MLNRGYEEKRNQQKRNEKRFNILKYMRKYIESYFFIKLDRGKLRLDTLGQRLVSKGKASIHGHSKDLFRHWTEVNG